MVYFLEGVTPRMNVATASISTKQCWERKWAISLYGSWWNNLISLDLILMIDWLEPLSSEVWGLDIEGKRLREVRGHHNLPTKWSSPTAVRGYVKVNHQSWVTVFSRLEQENHMSGPVPTESWERKKQKKRKWRGEDRWWALLVKYWLNSVLLSARGYLQMIQEKFHLRGQVFGLPQSFSACLVIRKADYEVKHWLNHCVTNRSLL